MADKPSPKPRISVLERRLQNPFGEPASPIDLKDRALVPRWFNAAIVADKIWRAKQKGWLPVRAGEVVDPDQVGGFTVSPDGFVTRGDRGQEVLMCMKRDDFEQIMQAKTKWNNRNMGNPHGQLQELAQAAGERFGDQAGEFLTQSRVVGAVHDSRERIERKDLE